MYRIIFLLLICSTSFVSLAQITFDKGYFIDQEGKRTECLIRNAEWYSNPSHFDYKLSASDAPKTMEINSLEEFGVDTFSKYLIRIVKIDRTREETDSLTSERGPVWREERLALKVLTEGKASLLFYQQGRFTRFFYNVNDSEFKQLVFKKYILNGEVAENKDYRQQLWSEVNCGLKSQGTMRTLSYVKSDLLRYFNNYNACSGSASTSYSVRAKGHVFAMRIKTGLDRSSFFLSTPDYNHPYSLRNLNFSASKMNFRLGLELEFVLPANRNKWSVLLDPTVQFFNATTQAGVAPIEKGEVSYRSLETPFGVRHYFFLGPKVKLFVNGLLVVDLPMGSKIKWNPGDSEMILQSFSFAGAGG